MSAPRQYRCVVADDEALIRRRVAELATSRRHRGGRYRCDSGREAIELIESLTPDIASSTSGCRN